jgi:Zn-dependent M28 family amino/carboxypeptidase
MRILAVGALAAALAGCSGRAPGAPDLPATFDGEHALELVAQQMAFGPRAPGTEAHDETIRWIADTLEEAGWEVETADFVTEAASGTNVVGRYGEGEAPPILLGAHYDTRPVADRDEASPTEPVPGANDGASGVAVLLELARVLPGDNPSRPIWLAFFDQEDGGGAAGGEWIQGSRAFAADLSPLPAAVVVVDMVGDADLQLREEMNSDPILRESIWQTAASLGFDSFARSVGYSMLDDHTPFIERGIPTVLIIDFDYPYWHTTQDTLDKISAQSLEAVGRTLETWLRSQP